MTDAGHLRACLSSALFGDQGPTPAVRHVAEALCIVNGGDPWAEPGELWDWSLGLAPDLLAENGGDVRATLAELWVE